MRAVAAERGQVMIPRGLRCKPGVKAAAAVLVGAALMTADAESAAEAVHWDWAGWGGGGFYYASAFHPAADGVIYMGGDVAGMYRSDDHGHTWRMINDGLADYGVFSLAVDRMSPDTVYAATAGGLCKSTDRGEHWRLLPKTGPKALRLTGEKKRSVRCVAVDPSDSRVVYAGSPGGKIYVSADGGETWAVSYEKVSEQDPPGTLRVQFGKVNNDWYGGFWCPLAFPEGMAGADCRGLGLRFKGDGTLPRELYVTLKTGDGAAYRSRNLRELFGRTEWGDVVLGAGDFSLDPEFAKKHPAQAVSYAGTPDWAAVSRMDFVCVGPLMNAAPVGNFAQVFFMPGRRVAKDFKADKVYAYGNVRVGPVQGGPVYTVAVAQSQPLVVAAATDDAGIILSRDGGRTWQELPTPKRASSVAIAPGDASVLYAAFFNDGVCRSRDGGASWTAVTNGLPAGCSMYEVAVSSANPRDVYAIGSQGWNGVFLFSQDGGDHWTDVSQLVPDPSADPTLPKDYGTTTRLSNPRNIAVNPRDPNELFIAANWRPCHSDDGGRTWHERVRGADISCVYDLRFHEGRTYAGAMDEGVLVSGDGGRSWRALCPLKYDPELSGHYWRLAVSAGDAGGDRIVGTCSPWDSKMPNRVVVSGDGGRIIVRTDKGLPARNPTANTMWGTGYPRALAVDPRDPKTLYMGIDGDPSDGCSGGGVFKSVDGGATWGQLPAQPGSRRMFFGLAVDPTESRRLYWGACGAGGGLYRSDDAGASWRRVFDDEQWVFDVHVAADGTVYCPGKNVWRSTDHGATWKKLTALPDSGRVIVALETDPSDARRLWFALTTWGGAADGGVYETRDGGGTWSEITGDLPYRKPLILRYNRATHELWAAGVGLFRCTR